ncbi:MAG: hypothetical protein ABMA26_13360 [Limisphaerales bacterium]
MSPPLPPQIRVESSRHGPRYILPPRETGPLKFMAVFMIGFGCLFGGFALVWSLTALGMTQKDGFQIGGVLFALFGVPFVAAGLGIIGLGVFGLCGRCEIEVTSGELIARERGGPFWWTRRIPLKDIQRFTLAADALRINDQPVKSGPMSDVGALSAEVGAAKPRLVLLGYPRTWTEALAARLTADLAAQTGAAPLQTTVTQTDPATGRVLVSGDRLDPPAGTAIRVMEQAGGIVVLVPPSGFKGVSRFLLGFSVCWLLISTILSSGLVAAAIQGKEDKPPWFVFVIAFGFVLIGLGMLASALNMARRKASIRASGEELILLQQSLFGSKTFKRSASELAAIRVGDSGMAINDVPVQELQVHTGDNTKHGFLSNLTNDELHWLATHLRHATGVGEAPGESPEPPKLAT